MSINLETSPITIALSSPEHHYDALDRYNAARINAIRCRFGNVPLDDGFAVALVGSHGKYEGTPRSKPEIIVISEDGEPETNAFRVSSRYDAVYGRGALMEDFDMPLMGMPESKVISCGNLVLAFPYAGGSNRYFPDRMLNSTLVAGSPEVHATGRQQVLLEMGTNSKEARHVRKKLVQQLKEYRASAESGMCAGRPVFEIDGDYGHQCFNNAPDSLATGFKFPFLRTTQRTLDLITARVLRDGNMSPSELAHELPTDVAGKLEFMSNNELSPVDPAVTNAYKWFLHEYHNGQKIQRHFGGEATVPFDKTAFQSHASAIIEFSHMV